MHTLRILRIPLPNLAWAALALIWGSTWLAVRIGLASLPPFTFAGLRFLIAAAILLAALAVRRTKLPRTASDWRLIIYTGLLGFAVSYSAQFWGMQFVPSGLAAVMFSTVPLFTMLFAHFALPSEPLRLRKLLGVGIGIGGVAFIFADQLATASLQAVFGVVAFLVGAAAMAASQVVVKARGTGLDPLVLAAFQMAVAAIVLLALGAAVEGQPGRLQWTVSAALALAYLALVGSALAFSLFYWLLKHMTVTKTLSVMLTHPPVAIFLGWLVLGESMGWRVFAGAAAIASGLWLILRPQAERQPIRSRQILSVETRELAHACSARSGMQKAVATEESR